MHTYGMPITRTYTHSLLKYSVCAVCANGLGGCSWRRLCGGLCPSLYTQARTHTHTRRVSGSLPACRLSVHSNIMCVYMYEYMNGLVCLRRRRRHRLPRPPTAIATLMESRAGGRAYGRACVFEQLYVRACAPASTVDCCVGSHYTTRSRSHARG